MRNELCQREKIYSQTEVAFMPNINNIFNAYMSVNMCPALWKNFKIILPWFHLREYEHCEQEH